MGGQEMPESLDVILREMSDEIDGFVTASVGRVDGVCVAYLRGNIDSYAKVPKNDGDVIGASDQNDSTSIRLLNLVGGAAVQFGMGMVSNLLLTMQDGFLFLSFLEGRRYYLSIFIERKKGNVGNLFLVSSNYAKRITEAIGQ
jgi:predicted regulator of Ras-like GTPase activity (Roadblock/LC7/MglB family)